MSEQPKSRYRNINPWFLAIWLSFLLWAAIGFAVVMLWRAS
jgi:hypothetical protein